MQNLQADLGAFAIRKVQISEMPKSAMNAQRFGKRSANFNTIIRPWTIDLEMNRHVSQELMSRLPHVAKLLKVSPTSDVKSFEEDMDNLLDFYATPAADSGRRLAQDPRKRVKSDCNRQSFQDRHLPPPQPPPHQRLPDLRS